MNEHPQELAARALGFADGDAVEVVVEHERSGFARFAESRLHQPALVEDLVVQLKIIHDGRLGVASTSRTSDDDLRALARRARTAAAQTLPNPRLQDLAPPICVSGLDLDTASVSANELAELAHEAISLKKPSGLELFGYVTSGLTTISIASTTGLEASQAMTDVSVVSVAAGEGISGYADAIAPRLSEVDPGAVAAEASEKALRTRKATAIEPGTYRVALEPYAVGLLLQTFSRIAFGALEFLDGVSYLSGRIGERVFDRGLTIVDDCDNPRSFPKAFDREGVPKRPVVIIEEGVARDVVWDRATASRAGDGHSSTGHAIRPNLSDRGPTPLNLTIAPGSASPDDLVAAVEDGIYITRLHYLSVVDQREGVITGMTRDGTFRIRRGRLAEPLVNLRFTTSVPELARALLAIGGLSKLVVVDHHYELRYPYAPLVPAIATAAFRVLGAGSAPGI
jgi:PmbA protein